jgi:disulfide bond formation protein DsbB
MQNKIYSYPLLATFATCIAALSYVLYAEIFLNIQPCHLCKAERIPLYIYIAAYPLLLFYKKIIKIFMIMSFLSFCGGMVTSFYHCLLMLGVVKASCGLNFDTMSTTLVSCTDSSFSIAGVSVVYICFAFYTLTTFAMVALCFTLFKKK